MSQIRNLKADYGDFQIDISDWEILDQGVTALCGPSGSGKTSVFRLLIGLEPCPSLEWNFQGVDLARLPTPDRRLGVVFQSYELFPHMTVEENLRFAAQARRRPRDEYETHLQELIAKLRLADCAKRLTRVISGGEKQRTALARALIGRPRILMLDEPFSALDIGLRQEARLLVKDVLASEKIPSLLITHDPEDLRVLASKISNIENGRLTEHKAVV